MIKANINEIELRRKIIKLAIMQLNKLYVHGSHGPDNFDCAGFVWYVYNEILNIDIYKGGYGLSTTTRIMTSNYGDIKIFNDHDKDLEKIKMGDIVLLHRQDKNETFPKKDNKYPGHCGIYLENSEFIHCSGTKKQVVINNFDKSKYWRKVLVASKDIVSDISKNRS